MILLHLRTARRAVESRERAQAGRRFINSFLANIMAKRKSAVAPSAASTPVAVGAPTPPAAALPPFLPLTHYLSVVPLQLVSLAFAFLTAANSTSQHGKVTSPAQLLAVLIARPIPTLALSCAGVLVVQAYFGLWSRTSRRNAMGLGRKASTRPKRGFWGAFEDMKAEFTAGHAPHSEAVREMKRVDLGVRRLPARGI